MSFWLTRNLILISIDFLLGLVETWIMMFWEVQVVTSPQQLATEGHFKLLGEEEINRQLKNTTKKENTTGMLSLMD